ncbi:hypothetical protein BY996DRAFT_3368848 [Phakopsora pachyrhizi]|nr:hypothetical protein BY996DRAFT_3368848 [Phakopsora pachyrhizi]
MNLATASPSCPELGHGIALKDPPPQRGSRSPRHLTLSEANELLALQPDAPQSAQRSKSQALKYDDEGCVNCLTNHSLCWWKKNKRTSHPDGSVSCVEEKLCNTCSIYWNKNGHHRAVKPTISKPTETVSLSKGTSAAPHDVFPKASCSTSKMPVVLSSPTPSRMRPRYGSQRSSSQLRPPSQLTLAAEREAQILKRGLSQKSARLGAPGGKAPGLVNINDFSDDEEDAPLFDSLASGLSIFGKVKKDDDEARCQSKHSRIARTISSSRSITSTTSSMAPTIFNTKSPTNLSDKKLRQISKTHTSSTNSSSPFNISNDPLEARAQNSKNPFGPSPPRTPPPCEQRKTRSASNYRESPSGQTFVLDNLLSPSFLDASPNSLIRKLSQANSGISDTSGDLSGLSASLLSKFPSGASEKVFSPSRTQPYINFVISGPSPAEPKKRSELSMSSATIGEPALSDKNEQSSSSNGHRSSIFSHSKSSHNLNSSKSLTVETAWSSNKERKKHSFFDEFCDNLKMRRESRDSIEPLKQSHKGRATVEAPPSESCRSRGQLSTESCRKKKSRTSALLEPFASSSKNEEGYLPRASWPRILDAFMTSSEHSQPDEPMRATSSSRPYLCSNASHSGTNLVLADSFIQDSGLTAAISRGLKPLADNDPIQQSNDKFYSENNLLLPSSPPVLPPPSDCSEGITPISSIPFSDGIDEPLEGCKEPSNKHLSSNSQAYPKPQPLGGVSMNIDYDLPIENLDRTNPLGDITTSMNQLNQPNQSQENELEGLSPEIISALNDAIRAGLSTDDLTKALRSFNSRPVSQVSESLIAENGTNVRQSLRTAESASQLSLMSFYSDI